MYSGYHPYSISMSFKLNIMPKILCIAHPLHFVHPMESSIYGNVRPSSSKSLPHPHPFANKMHQHFRLRTMPFPFSIMLSSIYSKIFSNFRSQKTNPPFILFTQSPILFPRRVITTVSRENF